MFVVEVEPKRGKAYIAPTKDLGHIHRLLRDACAMAEDKSQDDSVRSCRVLRATVDPPAGILAEAWYVDGKRAG